MDIDVMESHGRSWKVNRSIPYRKSRVVLLVEPLPDLLSLVEGNAAGILTEVPDPSLL